MSEQSQLTNPPQGNQEQQNESILHRLPLWYFIPFILLIILLIPALILNLLILKSQSKPTSTTNLAPDQGFTPTPLLIPNSTADWKTYTSSVLSVEFKYPPNFRVSEDYTVGTGIVDNGILVDLDQNQGAPDRYFFITESSHHDLWDHSRSQTIFDLAIGSVYLDSKTPLRLIRISDQSINNIKWQVYEDQQPYGYPPPIRYLMTQRKDQYFIIEIIYSNYPPDTSTDVPDIKVDYLNTFDQILSTFRFLDQEQGNSSWVTYEKPLYSYKLPSDINDLSCDMRSCWSQSLHLSDNTMISSLDGGSGSLFPDLTWAKVIETLNKNNIPYTNINISGKNAVKVNTKQEFFPFRVAWWEGQDMQGVVIHTNEDRWISFVIYKLNQTSEKDTLSSIDMKLFNQFIDTIKFNH